MHSQKQYIIVCFGGTLLVIFFQRFNVPSVCYALFYQNQSITAIFFFPKQLKSFENRELNSVSPYPIKHGTYP